MRKYCIYCVSPVSPRFIPRTSQSIRNGEKVGKKNWKKNEKEGEKRTRGARMECLMGPFRGESYAGYTVCYGKRGATRISCIKLHTVGVGAVSSLAAGAFVYSICRNNQSREQYAEIYRLYEVGGAHAKVQKCR